MPGPGHGAPPGDRVVDRVQTGGPGDRPAAGLLVLVRPDDEFVEMTEELVRGQVQCGEVVHRGAQPAHGGRGVQPVPDHVADDERDPGTGQRNHVEPVPAHPGLRRQIAVGDVQGVLLGKAAREQAALQGHRHLVLAGVAPGVVDADRRPRHQFLGEGQVLGVEGGLVLRAPEVGHAEDDPARVQGHGQQRVESVVQDPRGLLGVGRAPLLGRGQVGHHPGVTAAAAEPFRAGRHEADHPAQRIERMGRADSAHGGAAHVHRVTGG